MKPTIIYWALLVDCTGSRKTPKYRIEREALEYPPMAKLVGIDGFVSMYYKPNQSKKPDAPEMNLQAKDSLNFTGIKFLLSDGDMQTYAYGNPMGEQTYSKKEKPNPCYERRFDGYLFIMHYDQPAQSRPTSIELIVLAGDEADRMEKMVPSYCKQLQIGVYDTELEALRRQATPSTSNPL